MSATDLWSNRELFPRPPLDSEVQFMLLVLIHFLHCQDCLWTYRGNNILSGRVLFIIPKLIYFVRQERLLMLLMSNGEEDDGSWGGGEQSTVCFDMSSKQLSFTLIQHFHLNYLFSRHICLHVNISIYRRHASNALLICTHSFAPHSKYDIIFTDTRLYALEALIAVFG